MKPFDVEQAKQQVKEFTKGLVDVNREEIDRVAAAAIKRMEAEAGAFKDLKSETFGSLFRDASAVLIDEIEKQSAPSGDRALDVNFVRVEMGGPRGYVQQHIGPRSGEHIQIPNQKHRVLIFFIPVEE